MLSRLAIKAASGPSSSLRVLAVRPMSSAPAATKENPERDLVNFPRRTRPIDKPPVRLGFLPEEWFTFFHAKTGATGPYVFLATVGTYLVSKEIYVLEHEFYTGIAMFCVMAGFIKVAGPSITEAVNQEMDRSESRLKAIRQDEIDRCQAAISDEEKSQWMATSYETLIQAKKENVALQLEAAYRERLHEAYLMVKRRLDYQLEVSNVMRRVEQKHMVDWIINSVKKSITAKQEDDALKKCVNDLKGLATSS
jgi:F-type H+-transporting ATPase subunit b